MSEIQIPFKERRFYYCFDCGWGEKGVYEYGISFEAAKKIIVDRGDSEYLKSWLQHEEGHTSFNEWYILDQYSFNEEDWEGSEDY